MPPAIVKSKMAASRERVNLHGQLCFVTKQRENRPPCQVGNSFPPADSLLADLIDRVFVFIVQRAADNFSR